MKPPQGPQEPHLSLVTAAGQDTGPSNPPLLDVSKPAAAATVAGKPPATGKAPSEGAPSKGPRGNDSGFPCLGCGEVIGSEAGHEPFSCPAVLSGDLEENKKKFRLSHICYRCCRSFSRDHTCPPHLERYTCPSHGTSRYLCGCGNREEEAVKLAETSAGPLTISDSHKPMGSVCSWTLSFH